MLIAVLFLATAANITYWSIEEPAVIFENNNTDYGITSQGEPLVCIVSFDVRKETKIKFRRWAEHKNNKYRVPVLEGTAFVKPEDSTTSYQYTMKLPDNIPLGEYELHAEVEHKINPMRTYRQTFNWGNFEVM